MAHANASHAHVDPRAAPSPRRRSGDARAEAIAAMAALLIDRLPQSTAEALRLLRHAYPDRPLALRLAALVAAERADAPQK